LTPAMRCHAVNTGMYICNLDTQFLQGACPLSPGHPLEPRVLRQPVRSSTFITANQRTSVHQRPCVRSITSDISAAIRPSCAVGPRPNPTITKVHHAREIVVLSPAKNNEYFIKEFRVTVVSFTT